MVMEWKAPGEKDHSVTYIQNSSVGRSLLWDTFHIKSYEYFWFISLWAEMFIFREVQLKVNYETKLWAVWSTLQVLSFGFLFLFTYKNLV